MPSPIGPGDAIVVHHRYLYRQDDWDTHGDQAPRFFMEGIAFPNAPPPKVPRATPDHPHPSTTPLVNYNATAWKLVLEQLRTELLSLNTVRLYDLDPSVTYDEFFRHAATLGLYVLVPLTSVRNLHGILDRDRPAPSCYNSSKLFEYGVASLRNFGRFPNVLAGVVGNEVMNDWHSWNAAPCVKQYARDLQSYLQMTPMRQIPLLYAAQHSGIGAALTEVDTLRLTVDYLGCRDDHDDNNTMQDMDIIFGVNVESWCSSSQPSWKVNPNNGDAPGTYYQLDQGLTDGVTLPLVFSELGCSHAAFDRDSPTTVYHQLGGVRDWKQVPVVLRDMHERWSGFSAYAYWGNPLFHMMQDGPWNGRDVLLPSADFRNFQQQLQMAAAELDLEDETMGGDTNNNTIVDKNNSSTTAFVPYHDLPMAAGGIMDNYYQGRAQQPKTPPTCQEVRHVLLQTAGVDLVDLRQLPSYHYPDTTTLQLPTAIAGHTTNDWMDLDDAILEVAENATEEDLTIDLLLDNNARSDGTNKMVEIASTVGLIVVVFVLLLALHSWRRKSKQRHDYEVIV